MTRNSREQRRAGGEHGHGLGGRPADLGRLGDGVDEHQQGGGDRHGAEGVVAPRGALPTRLSGTTFGARTSAAAPMGTLKKKMYCHPT